MVQALTQADPLQQFGRVFAGIAAAVQLHGQHDVFQGIEAVEQLEGLEDESYVFGPQACSLVFIELAQALPGKDDFTTAGQVEPGQQTEQGRFAGAGGANDSQAVTLIKLQVEFMKDSQLAFRAGNHFAKVPCSENACAHGESDACMVLSAGLALICMAQNAAAGTVLIVGDSISAAFGLDTRQGWVALLEKRLVDQGFTDKVINASISGDTSAGGKRACRRCFRSTSLRW